MQWKGCGDRRRRHGVHAIGFIRARAGHETHDREDGDETRRA